jgi:hypothetical protein
MIGLCELDLDNFEPGKEGRNPCSSARLNFVGPQNLGLSCSRDYRNFSA